MTIADRIERSVANRKDAVFVRSELKSFGNTSQVGRALRGMVARGALVRLGVGVYAKAKPSVLTGKPIPISPLEVLGPQALTKLGVKFEPCRATKAYNSGASTQIPSGVVLNTGDRRVTRKIGFNGKYIKYERSGQMFAFNETAIDNRKLKARVAARVQQAAVEQDRLNRHHRIANALISLPSDKRDALISNALAALDRWETECLCSVDYVDRWRAILVMPHDEIAAAIVSDADGWGASLRQNSPFVGVCS